MIRLCMSMVAIGTVCALACRGSDSPADWSQQPLTETPEAVAGVQFTIPLPAGLKPERSGAAITWTAGQGAPRIRVEVSERAAPVYLDDAVERALAGAADHVVYRKSEVAGGYAVTHHDPEQTTIGAALYRKLPDQRTFICTAQITPRKSAGVAAMANWLQNICVALAIDRRSMKPSPH